MKSPLTIMGSSLTKESIIKILSDEWPLSAKKIHKRLAKNYNSKISYQATHKSLKELTQNKILEKRKQGYFLNKEWVKELGELGNKITSELKKSDEKKETKTYNKIVFKNHYEFIKWSIKFMVERVKADGKLDTIFFFRHVPAPNVVSNEDIKTLMPYFPKIKWTIYSKGSTLIDKWSAKYWKKLRVKAYVGKDIPTNDRIIIMNDYVINVLSPKISLLDWDKAYSGKVHKTNLYETIKGILNPKYKTIITITKDREIADLLREK